MMKKTLDKISVNYKMFEHGGLLLNYIDSIDTEEFNNIGLVITDLEMPEVSGFEVIKKLRGNSKYAHIAIAVNSSMSGDSNKDMSSSLGADAFISKTNPAEIAKLIAKYCV
jgi:two-component system chemotaxis response regulator CheV